MNNPQIEFPYPEKKNVYLTPVLDLKELQNLEKQLRRRKSEWLDKQNYFRGIQFIQLEFKFSSKVFALQLEPMSDFSFIWNRILNVLESEEDIQLDEAELKRLRDELLYTLKQYSGIGINNNVQKET